MAEGKTLALLHRPAMHVSPLAQTSKLAMVRVTWTCHLVLQTEAPRGHARTEHPLAPLLCPTGQAPATSPPMLVPTIRISSRTMVSLTGPCL